jgi:thiol:disulfide interchange protein DsbD
MMNRYGLVAVSLGLALGAGAAWVHAQPPSPIQLSTILESDETPAGSVVRVAIQAKLDPGFHVNSNQPLDAGLIATSLSLEPPPGIALDGVAWPQSFLFTVGRDELAVFGEEFVIGAAFKLDADLPAGSHMVTGSLRYQACDDVMCYFPTTASIELPVEVVDSGRESTRNATAVFDTMTFTSVGETEDADAVSQPAAVNDDTDADGLMTQLGAFSVLGTTGGYLGSDEFLEFIDRAESGRRETGWFEDRGPLAIVALILLGGLALNLTPCVLPMIPINLAIIGAGARAGSRSRGFALGSAYGLAMAAVYGVLGLVVILTAGTFGTINASPWFNLGIAALFVVLALAMFDVLQIDFSALQSKLNVGAEDGGSFVVAFGMGGVAALLAGACVAPVVIQVIVFSSNLYATGTAVALLLPFVLGLGMAIPWPIAGAGLTFMPKPGPWMVRVKQAFGVFILGTAVYYGYLSYGLFSQRWVDPEEVATSVQELLKEGWYASLSEGLAVAEAEGKPVLVDIWATWCKNCLTMDRTTLQDPNVQAALDDYVRVKFQAEDLSVPPAREVMERFEAIGLPAYAILRPSAQNSASAGE